jgi:Sad1 / UNC-like C-terminal
MSESALYGDATFTEDAVTTPPRRGRRVAKPPTGEDGQQDVIEPVMDRVSLWMQFNAWFGSMYKLIASGVGTLARSVSGLLSSVAHTFSSKWALLILFLLLAGIASVFNSTSTTDPLFDEDLRPIGFDISHKIRQWIPSSLSHPPSYLNDRDISSLQKRMSVVENEIHSMKKHVILNKEVLEELKNIIPEEMYLSTRNGETELPPNFWKAITQKVPKGFSLSRDKSETISRSDWDDFIAQNEAKVKAWQAEVSEDIWAKHLKEALQDGGVLMSKADVTDMINKRWEQSQILIKRQVKTELDNVGKLFSEHYKTTHGITAQEAKDIFTEMYNNLQLKAFAQGQVAENVAYYHLQRPNHFSFGLGAVVNPSVTSPTYAFAKERAWWPKRLILWGVGYGMPVPNPPAEALRKWDEAGDCWCSPAKGNGAGVQLGVLMANDLFPKEVVIEHIPKSATLDSASAPHEMELLAHIDGFNAQGIVGELSDKMFPDTYESHLSKDWILIGTWRYDMEDTHHVQHFYPQLDLQSLGVSTRQLVVRAKSNQGDSDHTCLYRVRVHGEVADKNKA